MPNLNLREVTPYPGIGDPEWKAAPQVYLRLVAFSEGGDDTPPAVELVSPPVSTLIGPNTPVVVNVTDATTFRRIFLTVRFPWLSTEEVIYDGERFADRYATSPNDRRTITGGFQFTLLRSGGWPQGGSMQLGVYPIDLDGNEA